MSHFLGEFDCKLDVKGRMMIPTGLKKQLPESEKEGLVINRGFEKHLVIYTRKESGEVADVKTARLVYTVRDGMIVRYELESLDESEVTGDPGR